MAEYIEREILLEHLRKDPLFDLVERYGITGVIQSIPAADVRVAFALKEDGWHHGDYCPNCGADMREES